MPISWGTKDIKLTDNETVTLPALTRQKAPKHLYDNYLAFCNDKDTGAAGKSFPSISRGMFYEILTKITNGGEKMLTAVDYVTGVLVNDQVTLLQRIVDDLVSIDMKPVLSNCIAIMRTFLKQQYDSHTLLEEEEVGTHGIVYGLTKPDLSMPVYKERCNACNFPNFCILELHKAVVAAAQLPNSTISEDVVKDAIEVIIDAAHKLELYRGHRVRVANQQVHLDKILKDMEKECLDKKNSSDTLIIADWKMKFEPMSSRETSQQHFAKRGIGWHGCLCLYFKYEEQCMEDKSGGVTSIEGKAVRYTVYCNQILEGSNKQDGLAVISMLEAFLTQLKEELPHIKTVTLQTDNAGCYQSKELLLLLAILNGCNKIKVTRYIHTETQDGKGLIDAHFAKGTAHVVKFMKTSQQNRIRVIATAKGLVQHLHGVEESRIPLFSLLPLTEVSYRN